MLLYKLFWLFVLHLTQRWSWDFLCYIGGHSTGLDSFIPNIKIQIILSCLAQFLCCNTRVSLAEFCDCSNFVWPNKFVETREFVSPNFVLVASFSC